MSIIHDALKKAEREREPRPQRLSLYGVVRTAPRRWHWRASTGMLIGLAAVGAVSTWLWLHSPGRDLSDQNRESDGAELASSGAWGRRSSGAADAQCSSTVNPAVTRRGAAIARR